MALTWALSSSSETSAPSASDHEGLQPLAELLVVDADHRDLDDRLVVGEQVLDLAREDVLAAGDDHLVVAAVDEEAAVGVEVADVAAATAGRRSPPCRRRRCSPRTDISLPTKIRPTSPARDLVARPRRRACTTVPRGGRPAVPGRGAQVLGRGDRRVGDLGRAVEVVEVVAEAVHPLESPARPAAPSPRAR